MKRVFKTEDDFNGYVEIWLLDRNNEVPDDLIWLHIKTEKEEMGFVMKKGEAKIIRYGLLKAIKLLNY